MATNPNPLAGIPDFLRPANAQTKVVSAPPATLGAGTVDADVDPVNPTTINVRDAAGYTPPVMTHEATHVFQLSRNAPFVGAMSQQFQRPNDDSMYDYGGADGLLQAQQQGKTIANYTPEQQARMVQNFQQETQDAIRGGDRVRLAKVTAAYQPFVGQLAKIPPAGANMTKMTQQDLTPPAPGVPPATVAGMPALPSKLIGGTGLEPTKYVTQSYQGKTIPNLVRSGNIDLSPGKRPNIPNPETGGMSSVWSTSFGTPEGETLVPRVTNGEDGKPPHILSDKFDKKTHTSEASEYYAKYGQHLGVFKDPDSATAYAQALHLDQAKQGGEVHPAKKLPPLAAANQASPQQRYVNTMQKHFQPAAAPKPATGLPPLSTAR